MLKVTLRNVWSHKRRLLSTGLSIVLGVAFMTGTFVITDTLESAFDDLFASVNEGVDAEVRGPQLFDSQFGGAFRARFDESVVDEVEQLDQVDESAGFVASFLGTVLDEDGDSIGGNGPPTILTNHEPDPDLNAFQIVDGRGPEADDEVVLDRAATEDGGYELGDEVTVLTPARKAYELVGVMAFGEADNSGGTVQAQFTLGEAQRIARAPGQLNTIVVRGTDIEPQDLVPVLEDAVPAELEVVTGDEAASQLADEVTAGFGFFQQILGLFGGVALLVAAFIIYNTFSILVAQRGRELALLRAIGAGRRQVLSSVLVEAAVVGAVAAALGLLAGVALAIGVTAVLEALGIDLPSAGLVVRSQTVAFAVVVGVVVTVAAAIVPAVRATRVAPVAALREVAIDTSSGSRLRLGSGVVLLLLAVVLISPALGDDPTTDDLRSVGLGGTLLIVAVVVLGPVIARPLVRLIGAPLPRLRGTTGTLARQNALRSPRRTASTAAALMIGIGLVGFITIFASSARASIDSEVARGFNGDFVVQPKQTFSFVGAPIELSGQLAEVEGVGAVAALRFGEAAVRMPGEDEPGNEFVGAIDPAAFSEVFDVRMEEGELTDLTSDGIVVDRMVARDNGLEIGDAVTVVFQGGGSVDLTVEAISDDQAILGVWTVDLPIFDRSTAEKSDVLIGISGAGGVDPETLRGGLEGLVDDYPTLEVLDRDQWVGALADQINQILNLVYGLLGLSVFIAVIGIANTLSLSIHERTRELGLLRAVGMDRRQVRSSVRWEAVIVALLGTVLGLAISLVVSFALVRGLRGFGLGTFQVPVGTLAVIVLLGAALGTLAAFRPARRAAKLDILQAIATE